MPATSDKQKRFMQMVLAKKKGKLEDSSEEIDKAARGMALNQIMDYTKPKMKKKKK